MSAERCCGSHRIKIFLVQVQQVKKPIEMTGNKELFLTYIFFFIFKSGKIF